MRHIVKIFLLVMSLSSFGNPADARNVSDTATTIINSIRRLNFVVSPKQKKFDAAPFSFQIQAKLMRIFHKKDFFPIIVNSSEEMAEKIIEILGSQNALIGNIWFDSHGHFTRRRSLFEIGEDEYNYQSICDTQFTASLKKLSVFCDTNTHIGIGSCYGGATYTLPAIEDFPAQPMHGDLLMKGLSELLNHATIYASESFVMTFPGIFNAGYALSGSPGRKKFKDPIYLPVWERLGEWNCYEGITGMFRKVNTVSLNQDGSIRCKQTNFLNHKQKKKKQRKKMLALKKGNYNLAGLYQ